MDSPPAGREPTRRTVLGTAGAGVLIALAGCTGGGGGEEDEGATETTTEAETETETTAETPTESNGGGSVSVDDYPSVDQWLTETEVGGADDSYDGSITDERGSDEVQIDVGSQGNGGYFAFGPSAVAVSPGTTVRWVWTGEGGAHNVVADPDGQIGETDYEFSSGDPVTEAGTEHTVAMDEPGVALYHCVPHLSLGMKGAVVVVE